VVRPDERILLRGPQVGFDSLSGSPDDRWLATSDRKAPDIRVWDTRNGRMVHEVPAAWGGESDFSADGKHLVTASSGHATQLWEVGSWRPERKWEYSGGAVFNRDGTVLAIRHTGNTLVTLVDVESGDELMTLTPPQPAALSALCFSADGSILAAA